VLSSQKEKQRREDQVDQNHKKDGHDYGAGSGTSHLLGSAGRFEPFETTHRGNTPSKHDALDQSSNYVLKKKRIERSANIPPKGKIRLRYAKERAAKNAHEIAPDGQAGQHKDHGHEFGHDQKTDRIDGHGLERIRSGQ